MSVAAVRKTVSVLFCDLAESTSLGERLDPETYRAVMGEWYESMRVPIERHGGTVEKFIGDAVMAVFGIPHVHEDDALRAVRAALEMRDAVALMNRGLATRNGVELSLRIGVNTGEVVAGDGDERTLVTGDAVNTAKRLEEAAASGEILIGEATRRLVRGATELEPVAAVEAKGKREPLAAWRVVAAIDRAATAATRADTAFVDRVEELAALREELAAVERDRMCRLVTVLGPAGIGKSRLVSHLLGGLGAHTTVLPARCLPYGDGITFLPLVELIERVGGSAALEATVADEPDRELILERLAALTGDTTPAAPEETFWAIRRMLEALAAVQPLVVRLDDIHWAEPTFLDLIEYVAGWSRDAPILLVCLARPEILDERPDWRNVRGRTMTLAPLSSADSDELLEALDHSLGADARARIRDAAEGNPLFVEQLAAMLADHPEETAMPATIHALLSARLDRLDPLERRVLERASVLGKEFARGALLELSPPGDRGGAGSALLALTRRELIEPGRTPVPGDDGFRFRHALIRDAAYNGIPRQLRAELHERAGTLVEQQGGAEELVGYHFEQAYLNREALGGVDEATRTLGRRSAELLGNAGREAFARNDMPAARNLLERALRLGDASDPSRLELQRELSIALWSSGDTVRADALLEELIAAAAAAGDAGQEWSGLLERAARRNLTLAGDAEADALLRVAADAIAVFESIGDTAGLARAWGRVAYGNQMRLRYGAAEDAALRALEYASVAEVFGDRARIVDRLCTSLLYGPAPADAAVRRCRELLEQPHAGRLVEANVSISLAGLLAMLGDFAEARASAERALEIYDDLGLRLFVAGWTQVAGPLELLAGDPAAAERHLRVGLEIFESVGSAGFQQALLAESLYQLGACEDAERFAGLARATSAADDVAAQVIAAGVLAKVEAARTDGPSERALASADEAATLASRTDALNLWGDSLVNLACVQRSGGDEDAARATLEEAAAVFRRKGNVVAAGLAVP
ncbi:MAG TPA: adenylate/guanylate cyclase domain-containing protein [Gaiellaceae bacterium]|nr:adenylate/guanylate cyclase domain-containing protein [Gaiellaceae bacterium]